MVKVMGARRKRTACGFVTSALVQALNSQVVTTARQKYCAGHLGLAGHEPSPSRT